MIRLLLDMGLPRRTALDLTSLGWDVTHIAVAGRPTAPDEEVLAHAEQERRVVVTCDSDFSRIMATRGSTRPSIIFIRVQPLARERATALIADIASAIEADLNAGCIATVTEAGIRIRRLPIR